jgi:hypothetical protein
MRRQKYTCFFFLGSLLLLFYSSPAFADISPRYARISLFGQAVQRSFEGADGSTFSEIVATLTFRSAIQEKGGFEYAFDLRAYGYPSAEGRSQRLALYDAYLGWRAPSGRFAFKVGQMWLNDLGGLGSIGGAEAEFVLSNKLPNGIGKLTFSAFGGLEPKIMKAGYVSDIMKFGGFFSLEGDGARRHILGYINVQNQGLTERSVLVFTNYVPVKRSFFLYQTLEYDLVGPAGLGSSKLTYFFANLRFTPWRPLELQGIYHRGWSIDTRMITENQLNGRPIDEQALEGLLYESLEGRLTFRFFSGYQIFAGYGQNRTSRLDQRMNHATFGFFAANLFKSGFDLRVSDLNYTGGTNSSYNALYISLGRNLGRSVYLEAYYSSSVSVFRIINNTWSVEMRPKTSRYGISSMIHLLRSASLLIAVDRLGDDFSKEISFLTGISYRF